jgi:DeoR/GlpR family transcriptional regulator of sugar metabolism
MGQKKPLAEVKMTKRLIKILDLVAEKQRVKVTALSTLFGVSQVTMRKDLDHLEEQGLIRREHGYACLGGSERMHTRMAHHYGIKKCIAKAAAAMVNEGETVMIESGSCCTFLAEELTMNKRDVTIITNSVFIANYTRHAPYSKIILLGGYYQPESQVVVGHLTKKCGEVFFADKFFIGVSGFSPKFGFTGDDHLHAQTIIELSEYAKKIVVLTESEKFLTQSAIRLARPERVTDVFTDERIPLESEAVLRKYNVKIHKVHDYYE